MGQHDEGAARRQSFAMTAQQTNLVRSVLRNEAQYLNHPHPLHPQSGVKTVAPLQPDEVASFVAAWNERPVACIRSMNRAIASLDETTRSARYLHAAFDLEILMDRSADLVGKDLVGIPVYLKDGYTDLGFFPSNGRREKILVDKERLGQQLLSCKHQAVREMASGETADGLRRRLIELGTSLRGNVGYNEGELGPRRTAETVLLSDCVERRSVACRHLSILMQLQLQECGIGSRIVKGVLRLYGLKGRHAWNVVEHGGHTALVDVTFAEDEGPLVLVGTSLDDLYARAGSRNRVYTPSPETSYHYELRRSGSLNAARSGAQR